MKKKRPVAWEYLGEQYNTQRWLRPFRDLSLSLFYVSGCYTWGLHHPMDASALAYAGAVLASSPAGAQAHAEARCAWFLRDVAPPDLRARLYDVAWDGNELSGHCRCPHCYVWIVPRAQGMSIEQQAYGYLPTIAGVRSWGDEYLAEQAAEHVITEALKSLLTEVCEGGWDEDPSHRSG